MSQTTEADIEALVSEMKNLRSDFSRIGEILKDTARHGSADAADKIREHAERGWNTARDSAQDLIDRIEEKPVQSALIVFAVGLVVGLLMGRR